MVKTQMTLMRDNNKIHSLITEEAIHSNSSSRAVEDSLSRAEGVVRGSSLNFRYCRLDHNAYEVCVSSVLAHHRSDAPPTGTSRITAREIKHDSSTRRLSLLSIWPLGFFDRTEIFPSRHPITTSVVLVLPCQTSRKTQLARLIAGEAFSSRL